MLLNVGIAMVVVGLLMMFGPVILFLLLGGAGVLTATKSQGQRQVLEDVARERPTKTGKPVSLFRVAGVLLGGQLLIMAVMFLGGLMASAGVVAIIVHVLQVLL